jgi:hypothetical protein
VKRRIRALALVVLVPACAAKQAAPQDPIQNSGGNTSMQPVEQAPRPGGHGADRDGDGVLDDSDRCPDDPEDYDGFADADGGPDPDNDSDGILDVDDLCPNEPEPKDGNQDDDGCPP